MSERWYLLPVTTDAGPTGETVRTPAYVGDYPDIERWGGAVEAVPSDAPVALAGEDAYVVWVAAPTQTLEDLSARPDVNDSTQASPQEIADYLNDHFGRSLAWGAWAALYRGD